LISPPALPSGSPNRARSLPHAATGQLPGNDTVIRSALLPTTMALLGERNWYLPRRLAWLPRLGPEGSAARSQAIAPAPEMADHAGFAAELSGVTSRTTGQP
jgi:hypothetical protein